jgi:hypothetical protein
MYGGIDLTGAHFKDANENIFISEMYVDQGFLKCLNALEISPADEGLPTRHGQIIINEEAVNKLNLPANPVGQQIVVGRDSVNVCAVVKNFNFASLHHKIEPICLFVLNDTDSTWHADNGDCLFAKIRPHTNIPGLLASVKMSMTVSINRLLSDTNLWTMPLMHYTDQKTGCRKYLKYLPSLRFLLHAWGCLGLQHFLRHNEQKKLVSERF